MLDSLTEFSSDHNPVLLELDINPTQTYPQEYKERKTNWATFRQLINNTVPATIKITDKQELDLATALLQHSIKSAILNATSTITNKRPTDDIKGLPYLLREKR